MVSRRGFYRVCEKEVVVLFIVERSWGFGGRYSLTQFKLVGHL